MTADIPQDALEWAQKEYTANPAAIKSIAKNGSGMEKAVATFVLEIVDQTPQAK